MKDKILEEQRISDDTFKEIFPRRLERKHLYGKVYDKLKSMILSGKLKKGQRLVEEQLAYSLNVSRQPVRAALHQLAKDKLIVRKGKEGTFVL